MRQFNKNETEIFLVTFNNEEQKIQQNIAITLLLCNIKGKLSMNRVKPDTDWRRKNIKVTYTKSYILNFLACWSTLIFYSMSVDVGKYSII